MDRIIGWETKKFKRLFIMKRMEDDTVQALEKMKLSLSERNCC